MHNAAAAAPTAIEQKELVQRILTSEQFKKSHRLSAFLRFIFEQHSRGQTASINEQRIGTEVFGRPQGYHAGEDSIVRSQARFLRQRLEEYFSTEGKQEPVLLSIPKGSYVPAFERRTMSAALPLTIVPTAITHRNATGSLWMYRVLLGLSVCIGSLPYISLYHVRSRQAAPTEAPAVKAFWASLFNSDRMALIVPADTTLVLIQELTGKPVRLHSYINKDYLNTKPEDHTAIWNMVASSQYTSTADLDLVARLQRVPEAVSIRPAIRYARDLNLKDLKESNAVLIGGLRANPWMELFASSSNFDVDYDVTLQRDVVRNRAPGPKEKPLYIEKDAQDPSDALAYGVVVYLQSLDSQGHSLLVEGTNKAGTEAAAEFLTSPAFNQFLQTIGANEGKVPNFELLLSTGIMDGASYHPEIVCWHLLRKNANS